MKIPIKNSNQNTNFYQKMGKKFSPVYLNPGFKNHQMNIPFRCLIVGSSGAGKSNLALEILSRMNGTFQKVVLCVKNADEPLYNYLRSIITDDRLTIYEGLDELPNVDSWSITNPDHQILVIFDDLCLEKDQSKITQYFIRGRKIAKSISMLYLTQSYYQSPKTIRLQCNYVILKKLSCEKDLTMILSDFSLGIDKKKLIQIYKYATENQLDFLMLDLGAPSQNRFRRNFLEVLDLV